MGEMFSKQEGKKQLLGYVTTQFILRTRQPNSLSSIFNISVLWFWYWVSAYGIL